MIYERLKRVASIRVSNVDKTSVQGQASVKLCNYTDVYYNERISGTLEFMTATATPQQCRTFALRSGDVLLTKDSETAEDIGASASVADTGPDLVCGYHLAIVRPLDERVVGGYLRWVLASTKVRQQLASAATGVTRFGLRSESIANLMIPVPTLRVQRGIADYLDRETELIDALIAAKQRMLGLMEEAFVARVEASLNDEDATAVPLRRLLTVPPQYGASEAGYDSVEGWPRYVRITDLDSDGVLRDDDVRSLPPDAAKQFLLEDGDLLMARSGATVGKAFAYRSSMGPCCFAGYLIRFRFDRQRLLPGLVELWTRTNHYWDQISQLTLQATIENVSAEKYKELSVPVPPVERQAELLQMLDMHRTRTRRIQRAIEGQLRLLADRRQALVTAAVTRGLGLEEAP